MTRKQLLAPGFGLMLAGISGIEIEYQGFSRIITLSFRAREVLFCFRISRIGGKLQVLRFTVALQARC